MGNLQPYGQSTSLETSNYIPSIHPDQPIPVYVVFHEHRNIPKNIDPVAYVENINPTSESTTGEGVISTEVCCKINTTCNSIINLTIYDNKENQQDEKEEEESPFEGTVSIDVSKTILDHSQQNQSNQLSSLYLSSIYYTWFTITQMNQSEPSKKPSKNSTSFLESISTAPSSITTNLPAICLSILCCNFEKVDPGVSCLFETRVPNDLIKVLRYNSLLLSHTQHLKIVKNLFKQIDTMSRNQQTYHQQRLDEIHRIKNTANDRIEMANISIENYGNLIKEKDEEILKLNCKIQEINNLNKLKCESYESRLSELNLSHQSQMENAINEIGKLQEENANFLKEIESLEFDKKVILKDLSTKSENSNEFLREIENRESAFSELQGERDSLYELIKELYMETGRDLNTLTRLCK